MGKVSIVRTTDRLKDNLNKSISLIGGLGSFVGRGDSIMLKPNLNDTDLVTNIDLTKALIELLKDFGVKKLSMGESTFGTAGMTDKLFKHSGYFDLAQKHDIELINFNSSEIKKVKVKNPLITETLNIAKEIMDVDSIINLPVMKVHYATGVTLTMKNLKGILVLEEKKHFHDIGLHRAIVDLNNTIKPTLNIIDGTFGMETMGPKGGEVFELGLLVSGKNSMETDYVASSIMGYSLSEVEHLKICGEMNYVDFDAIDVLGESIENVKHPFKKVNLPVH